MEPREVEVAALKGQVATVNAELSSYHTTNTTLDARIGALRAEIESLRAATATERADVKAKAARTRAFEVDLYTEVQGAASTGDWLGAAARLVRAHGSAGPAPDSNVDLGVISEALRQQRHLEQRIKELRAEASSGAVGGEGAAELVAENAAIISQVASLSATIGSLRVETKALVLKAAQRALKGTRERP